MKKNYILFSVLLYFLIVLSSNVFAQTAPTINSFSPTNAKPGDAVTLSGINFNTLPTNNIVFFGAIQATVTTASTTSLTVTVPSGAIYSPISVLNTGTALACYSLNNFNPVYSPAKSSITTTDFATKVDFTSGTAPYSVAIGDLDGDGKSDLAVANANSHTISVFRNTTTSGSIGAASFATKVDFATNYNPRSIAISDLDGDGKLDLVAANYVDGSVSVLRNTATSGTITASSFATKVDFITGSGSYSVAIGDLDGDGKPDLAVANLYDFTVSLLRNTTTSGTITTSSFATKVDFPTEPSPKSIAIGDLDGDGKPDLAVVNNSISTVSVLRNTATRGTITTSSFAAKVGFAAGFNPEFIALGDLDGDGKLDLAVTNNNGAVSVLRNTAVSGAIDTGSFAAKVDFKTGASPVSVAIGDLDGDGKPDLAVANANNDTVSSAFLNTNSVSVLRNTATNGAIDAGSFASKINFATSTDPKSVTIGDLDGDGKPDLVVASYVAYNSGVVSVLRNTSNNTNLSVLTTNTGALDPNFDATTTAYTVKVPNAANTITLTPTKADDNATILVNGVAVASGSASGTINLSEGSNTITVVVTAQNGTSKIYTLTIKRASLLDKLGLTASTPATTAYSLRKLSSNYTGNAIKVRRSSDDTLLDIGFDASGGLNTTALTTFAGSSSVYVTKWYDQSGDGNDATQTNTALQPRIVNAGVLDRLNNRPAVYFGTANLVTAKGTLFATATSMVGFAKGNSSTPSSLVTKSGTSSDANNNYPAPFDFTNSGGQFFVGNASTTSGSNNNIATSTPRADVSSTVPASVYSFVIPASGSFYSYLNGVQSSSGTVSAYADNGNAMQIGNRNGGGGSGNFWTTELVLFNSVLSTADRQIVETSQTNYYNNNNTNLSALSITGGTMSPAFAIGTTAYTATVSNATTTTTVTPTVEDALATVQVQINGGGFTTITSGTSSSALVLNVGNNSIEVKVTAQNGDTKTYTITLNRRIAIVLDTIGLTITTQATTAYSLRKLASIYSGNAIQVRRSSDNALLEIGFDVSGGLDTAALTAFVGSFSGYVTKWYDQSGNGNDATQANTTLQPRIVNAGVLDRLNNRPAVFFGTANLATAKGTLFFTATSMVGFAKGNSTTSSSLVTKTGTASDTNTNYPAPFDFTNGGGNFFVGNANTTAASYNNIANSTPRADVSSTVPASVYSFVIPASGTFYSYLNGIQSSSGTVSAYADNGNALQIGNRNDGSGSGNFWTTELVLFNSTLSSTDRQIVETSQKNYYNSNNANLSALTSSAGTISPVFATATTAYTATVSNATTTTTVTPTVEDALATVQVQVNGGGYTTIASGTSSSALVLNVGNNSIDIKVTAQNGDVKTYILTICRGAVPTFTAIDPICQGSSFVLPAISNNGITGTWSPSINTTATTTYTFTADGSQCAELAVLTVNITPSTYNVTTIASCGSYIWNNQTYSQSGIYTGTTTNCVTEKLNLTITPNSDHVTTISNCGDYTWVNNGQVYTTSGIYTGTTTNCVTEKLNLTITPNSDHVTTISNCGNYTWANNGQVYTTSGIYTGTTTNCVTEKLNLTITPNSDHVTTISNCGDYTWANNGQVYTTSGIYTGTTTNCVTEKLNLTITPNSDHVTTISNCGNYTWANNNQVYAQSGIYTGTTTNCVTEKLDLTITPNSDHVTTISNCSNYTWANNNQVYTTSGIYTGTTTNCVTEKLNLTITPNSDHVTTISNCGNYTWANNNQVYTTSGFYTGATTNCVTEKLDLTITPSSDNITTATACDSYTWNGTVYTTSGVKTGTTINCVTEKLNLTITPSSDNVPIFTQVSPMCSGNSFTLPTTSNNGITGTWSPPLDNTNTTTYTFTPTPGLCAASVQMTVLVKTVPVFEQISPVCSGESISALPTTSTNGATGRWTPAIDNTKTTTYIYTPADFVTITAGPDFTIGIKTDGTLWGWGSSEYVELGFGKFAKTPIQIGTGTNWQGVACGEMHVIAIQKDGTLWAWGYNENAQLGDGTKINKDSPTRIGTATNWKSVSAARNQSFAIQTDGTLWSWGENGTGQLGYYGNTTIPRKIDNPNDASWKAVSSGQYHTFAIQTNGTLWGWGRNGFGQLGNGSTSSSIYQPQQIAVYGNTNSWMSVACGEMHTVAVRDDGTLWAWGSNHYGQLGDGTTTNQLIPVKIGAATNWKEVTVGFGNTVAVKTDGTLWSWGNNEYGQLGDGTTTNQLIPKRIGTETLWKSISEGYGHTAALKSDGTLWAWGYNGAGQFGDGTTTSKHNPTQITQSYCASTMTIEATSKTIPTFTTIAPLCSGSSFTLPTTSNNGITGTWSPSINTTATTIYTFTPDANQCADSAMLTIAITASLDHVTTATACDSYTWVNNNQVYTKSGIYTGKTINCVTEKLYLTITPATDNTTTASACESYVWNGVTYTASGIYTGTTTNCVTEKLDLTINPISDHITTQTACGSYIWNGIEYTVSGIYTATTTNCVTEKLDLTITLATINTTTASACESYVWNGVTYTTSGIYTGTTTNCVTEKLDLTITPATINTTTASACGSYIWNGITYTISGIYTGTTTNCVTEKLDLTITPATNNTTTASACGSYLWNGITYTVSGIYNGTTTNCITEKLDLTINSAPPNIITTVSKNNGTLMADQVGVGYQWINCDGTDIVGETNQSFTPTISGQYAVRLLVPCSFPIITDCATLSTDDFSTNPTLKIYPNPSKGMFYLQLPSDKQIEVYDNLGQLILAKKINSGTDKIDLLEKADGIYFIKIMENGKTNNFKVIKN
ncbi:FG-GAP-like repeat-containing protein [Flavobacterium sp.]|uniref:RCC1 domain-containing protein n=1 Tax=Flavobacterium sp. TaxID=239 RepID=UPI003D125C7C